MTSPEVHDGKRSGRRLQINLFTLLSLIAAVAAWAAFWRLREEVRRYEVVIPAMRDSARVLEIDDPGRIAVVRHHELWNDDFRWRVFLPDDRSYQLALATDEIEESGLAVPKSTVDIPSGEHELLFTYRQQDDDRWRLRVELDGDCVIECDEESGWNLVYGSQGGAEFRGSVQRDPSEPLVLFRRRFFEGSRSSHSPPKGAASGAMLWIEESP